MRHFLLLLTILPAGSDLMTNPPTGRHLCFCPESPCSLHSLSLGQGGSFDTTHKETLQAD
jgi:hypothetical protein